MTHGCVSRRSSRSFPLSGSRLLVAVVSLMGGLPRLVAAPTRSLSFDERVSAQEAIEGAHYSHQLGATTPFAEAVPRDLLERKVRTYLKQSAALETLWNTPVTAEMLGAELDRIARQTRFPDRLLEIYHALGDDPVVILECFARQALVDRMSRSFFSFDGRIHAGPRREAAELRQRLLLGEIDSRADRPGRTVLAVRRSADDESTPARFARVRGDAPSEGGIVTVGAEEFTRRRALAPQAADDPSAVEEVAGGFLVHVLLDEGADSFRIATFGVAKTPWQSWWEAAAHALDEHGVATVAGSARNGLPAPGTRRTESREHASLAATDQGSTRESAISCAPDDIWLSGNLADIPIGRYEHTAVWTGTEMIVWGGYNIFGYEFFDSGSRYDPLTDTWTSTSRIGAPTGRFGHTAVWAGEAMLVWGGLDSVGLANDGGRYDPETDSWTPMSTDGAPPGRVDSIAIWTGSRMLVWGGSGQTGILGDGGRYDPVADVWEPISMAGAPSARSGHSLIWTGHVAIVWGGGYPALGDGGRYDPESDAWSPVSMLGAPVGRSDHYAVWSGQRMLIWGGASPGGRYDPATDTWQSMSTLGAPNGLGYGSAVWAGNRMIVWGGWEYGGTPVQTGARYDPVADTWSPTSLVGAPSARSAHTAVSTGALMLIWGGEYELDTGGRYDPAADVWTPTATAPPTAATHAAVWTGTRMLIWGRDYNSSYYLDDPSGASYDPLTNAWSIISSAGAPAGRYYPTAVWTGSRMVVWGGYSDGGSVRYNTGGRYDPIADAWSATSTVGAPAGRSYHSATWTGAEMIVWGGIADYTYLASGGRYNPTTDTWLPTSAVGAPPGRYGHSTVWTGAEMLVWGGRSSNTFLGTGARYHAASDTWAPIQTAGSPVPRLDAAATWTGSRLLVWGGWGAPSYTPLQTGGAYDPLADTWVELPTAGRPQMGGAPAVWTGAYMLVWGGEGGLGGRFNPAAWAWTPLTWVDSPFLPQPHTAIWTGEMMIVWGGRGYDSFPNGGRYVSAPVIDADGDGYGTCQGDCDEAHASVHPLAVEICDGLDNDCDGDADGFYTTCGTGICAYFGSCLDGVDTCVPGDPFPEICDGLDDDCDGVLPPGEADADADGLASCQGDCDDADAARRPGASEACNGLDDDCDGVTPTAERDLDDDGYLPCTGDCDDASAASFPGNPEGCDGRDNDCNGSVDGFATSCGLGVCAAIGTCVEGDDTCTAGAASPEGCDGLDGDCDGLVPASENDADGDGYRVCAGDCADGDPLRHPGRPEICNGVDDDCDGTVAALEGDADGDGFRGCEGDCDDDSGACFPGNLEICDARDNDCNGTVDGFSTSCGIGVCAASGSCVAGVDTCNPGSPAPEACNGLDDDCNGTVPSGESDFDGDGYRTCAGDCADGNPGRHPGAQELCNGVDDDCDGSVPVVELDADHDGYRGCGGDCDDQNANRRPLAPELCNGVDDNCDGSLPSVEADADGDGVRVCSGDCDDLSPVRFPGNPEACDGLDNDCDGSITEAELDADGDGVRVCAGDCAPLDPTWYPGAPEIHDGRDNQCPGDAGFGVIDEISGTTGFLDPDDPTLLCWPPQAGATAYEVARSGSPGFPAGCGSFTVSTSCASDPTNPESGAALYYLVRASAPYGGSWGQASSGAQRAGLCGAEICDDGLDNDGDGLSDCSDPDCVAVGVCGLRVFQLIDLPGDSIPPQALSAFFSSIVAAPTDYIRFSLQSTSPPAFEWCAQRADFYRDQYLALGSTGGQVASGGWSIWYRAGGGSWTGPVADTFVNYYGNRCFGPYSWCSEVGLGGRAPSVDPDDELTCEARDAFSGCSYDGSWTLTITVGADRTSACGF